MTAVRLLPAVCRQVRREVDARDATAGPATRGATAIRLLPAIRRRANRDTDSTTW